MGTIRRAVLSCYDKTGVVEFAEVLHAFDVEIIATEGTHRVVTDAGLPSTEIANFTGVREMLGGRVKSLHPSVHAGLLGVRDNKLHCEEMATYGFQWIDLVAVNLHPLADIVSRPEIALDEVVEQIDIGGVAMIRSAAKNFRYVTVAVNPDRYKTLIHELQANEGAIPFATRFRLAQEAFAATAEYDRVLADYLGQCEPPEQ